MLEFTTLESNFQNLRRFIYTTKSEFQRFRELVVNTVSCTDIMDVDLKKMRDAQWEKAFHSDKSRLDAINRKATIVIAHLIQASDVAHTMQVENQIP